MQMNQNVVDIHADVLGAERRGDSDAISPRHFRTSMTQSEFMVLRSTS
jgi:hypothetical protein